MSDVKSLYDEDFVAWPSSRPRRCARLREPARTNRSIGRTLPRRSRTWVNRSGETCGAKFGGSSSTSLSCNIRLRSSRAADGVESITAARAEIEDILEDSPSLRPGIRSIDCGARPRARSSWRSTISRNTARSTIRLAELCEAPAIPKSRSSAIGFRRSPGSRRAAPGSHDRIGGDIGRGAPI